jgi:geranylgeranyl reductase family protein
MKKTDVIIVGAGPAGSWLGFRLAQAGIESVILEKEQFPRYKACGGGLSQKTIEFLPFSLDEIAERQMAGAWIGYRQKQVLVNGFGPAGAMVMRDTLDDFLVKRYFMAGGSFFDGQRADSVEETPDGIHVTISGEVWHGKILVGADGASSFVRRACGFGQHRALLLALAAEMKVAEEVMRSLGNYACFDLDAIPRGYGWISPKRNHLSIGVFTSGHHFRLSEQLKRFCQSHPLLRAGEIFRMRGGALPVGGCPRLVQKDRVLLVGDAAGTVEPFLGEGIYNALLSADMAADAIAGHLNHHKALSIYSERLARTVDANIVHARRLAKLFYGHLPWTFPLLVQNRIIARAFAREVIGKSDFSACLRYCLKRLPLFPFSYRQGITNAKAFSITSASNRVNLEET